ncbi:MAG: 3-deoxy-D-manno-octulosonic acid transferase [Gammaproteobacteria bacterium]|nr:MAG: 3-deoxy-D-manno-octulosonic acid transferase [Gammaproteobacteria bacterium]
MNRQIYTLGLYCLLPIILFYFLYRGIKDPRYLKHFSERLGFAKKIKSSSFKMPSKFTTEKTLLIHCASVGETKASIPLISQLFKNEKFSQIIITNTTPTGREETEKLITALSKLNNPQVKITHYYLPIDWPVCCQLFLNSLNLDAVVLMETELWPNFIHQCKQKNIPILLANARMSEKSAKKYQRHPKLTKGIFSGLSLIACQYQSDKTQFLSLDINEQKVTCVGSIKFDIKIDEHLKNKQIQLKKLWRDDRPCWIACSIHPGEFSAILSSHKELLTEYPNLLLIAVPRHPEQFEVLKNKTKEMQFNYVSHSKGQAPNEMTQLVIGDTMGELTLLCGVADIAFVGGSLIARGGHNPLEPAVCGLPVLMGNSDYNFSDVSIIMQESECLSIVNDEKELASKISSLLSQQDKLPEHHEKTQILFEKNGQAVIRLTKLIEHLI